MKVVKKLHEKEINENIEGMRNLKNGSTKKFERNEDAFIKILHILKIIGRFG